MIHQKVPLILHFPPAKGTFLKFMELFFFKKTWCLIAKWDIILIIEKEPFWIEQKGTVFTPKVRTKVHKRQNSKVTFWGLKTSKWSIKGTFFRYQFGVKKVYDFGAQALLLWLCLLLLKSRFLSLKDLKKMV